MNPNVASVLQFSLLALSSIFFLVDPFGAIPSFLVMTSGDAPAERRRMAKRAALTCFVVLASFALAGSLIFKFLGITLPAFKIAGGIILVIIGLEMLQARQPRSKESPGESEECAEKEDVGIIPLGIPMLAGPGAISSVMVLTSQSPNWWQAIPVFVAIGVTSLLSYGILSGADRVRRFLGQTGIHVLMRMMGLLLTTLAVQFIINGLTDLGVIHR